MLCVLLIYIRQMATLMYVYGRIWHKYRPLANVNM